MGYTVDSWETDFHIPADKMEAALAAVNANPELQRDCWNKAHDPIPLWEKGSVRHRKPKDHECQRLRQFDSLTDAVEDLTGFHDCEEDDIDGFRLGYHLDKWMSRTDDVLHALAQFADEGSYVRLLGEGIDLFGYRVVDGKLVTESATVTWSVP